MLFVTRNRFELLKPAGSSDETIVEEMRSIANPIPVSSKSPLPNFIKVVEDFHGVCTALIELIGVDNFICKSAVGHLKIQTSYPEAYRALVHYWGKEESEFLIFQLK